MDTPTSGTTGRTARTGRAGTESTVGVRRALARIALSAVVTAVTAVTAAATLAPSALSGQESEAALEWSGRLASGDFLEVRGISGDIRATLAPGARAEVVATKDGRPSDFDEVEIRVVEERGGVVVCAVYHPHASDEGCDGDHGWDDHDDGRHHRRNIDVSVDFDVRVPAGVEFFGSMVSGDVEAEGLRSDVEASTVSGHVFVSTTGVARGSTVSGEVEVEMGSLDWDRLHFSTVSGDITVRLPAGVGAEVEFESLSGRFDSDLEMTSVRREEGRFVGSELTATLGDGGRRLTFETVSGDVRLRRSRTVAND